MYFSFVSMLALALAVRLTGAVIGDDGNPLAGATVEVVRSAGEPTCAGTTGTDGRFAFSCDADGRFSIRASLGGRIPWTLDDVELGPGRAVELNFLLRSSAAPMDHAAAGDATEVNVWTLPVPNPILAIWRGKPISLRSVSAVVAALAFVCGGLTMLALGRRFGVATHSLSPDEVVEMILNPQRPGVGERTQPIATVGARGAETAVSFGADEIAAALERRQYGLVLLALIVAPLLFALATAAFAVALLVGQELWLLLAMLLVPAGFIATAVAIAVQAFSRRRPRPTSVRATR